MSEQFQYDVFLSHSAKDKAVVRDVAERLRKDGVKVWFDEWEIRPGDSIPAKIEEGLERSRVLVLCMSAHAFGSDWAQLESGTFRFRDPLNKERRFLPLRLDDAPIKGSLAQFLYINWLLEHHESAYQTLLAACRSLLSTANEKLHLVSEQFAGKVVRLDFKESEAVARVHAQFRVKPKHLARVEHYAFDPEGKRCISAHSDPDVTIRLWDLETGQCLRVVGENRLGFGFYCVVWSKDYLSALSGGSDKNVKVWDVNEGCCLRMLEGHTGTVSTIAWGRDERRALSGSFDRTIRLWDVEKERCVRAFKGHTEAVYSLAWCDDQLRAVSGAGDATVRVWEVATGRCLNTLEGHTQSVQSVVVGADLRRAISGSMDTTMRLWDLDTGRCLRVFEGHGSIVWRVAWSTDQRFALSASFDETIRLWEVETGRCVAVLSGHTKAVYSVQWSQDQRHAFSGDHDGEIRVWDLSELVL